MRIPPQRQQPLSGPDRSDLPPGPTVGRGAPMAAAPPERPVSEDGASKPSEMAGPTPVGAPQGPRPPGQPPRPSPLVRDYQGHWRQWLASPAGRYVLDWEQAHLDSAVANLFGFVAVQCGLRELDSLRQSRMRGRFLVSRSDLDASYGPQHRTPNVVIERYEELPLATESADLIVLPHVLEFARDPHQVLREIDRVLRPDGRAIIIGFNPISLWGIGQSVGRLLSRPPLPPDEHFIGLPRLRDWCKLLSFEFQAGSYGCYRPLVASDRWLDRTRFMEKAGDRWWPICGAVYSVTVVKRVRGMRLLGPAWKKPARRVAAIGMPAQQVKTRHLRNK